MVKTNKGTGQRKKKGDPLVQCDHCSRWVFLEETEFEDVEAANAAAWFDCKTCSEIKALWLRLRATEAQVEELRALVQRPREQLACELARNPAEASKVDGAVVSLGGPVDSLAGPEVPERPEEEGVESQPRVCGTEEMGALDKAGVGETRLSDNGDTGLHRRSPNGKAEEADQARESGSDPQKECQGTAPLQLTGLATTHWPDASQAVTRGCVADATGALKAGEGKEVLLPAAVSLPPVSEQTTVQPAVVEAAPQARNLQLDGGRQNKDGKPHVNTVEHRRVLDDRNGKDTNREEAAREVLIVGDTNASRITRALQRQLGASGKRSVHWCRVRRALAEDIKAFCSRPQEDPGKKLQFVILHLGLTDVLEGAQPEAVVEAIRETLVPHTPRLAICSVPEISTRGKKTHKQIVLLNSLLRKLCDSLKVTFLDLSACTQGEGRIARDGIHFLAETARTVAGLVDHVVSSFLGVPKQTSKGKDRGKRSPAWHRTSPRIFRRSKRDFLMEGAMVHGVAAGPRRPNVPVRSEEPFSAVELKERQQVTGAGVHNIPGNQQQGAPPWSQMAIWNRRHHPPAPVILAPDPHPLEPPFPAGVPPMAIHPPSFAQGVHPPQQMPVDVRIFHMVGDFVRQHLSREWSQRA